MGKLQGQLHKLSQYGGRAAGALDRNLGRIAVIGTGAALYGAKRIVQAAADYQDALAQIEKTLSPGSKTVTNLAAINKGLIDLSKTMPITAVDLADIARQAGQLGIEAAPEMIAFTETVAKLARVTDITAGFAAENMGKLRTIFQFTAKDTTHFGNVLVALENSAASSVTEIINISRRFAQAGRQAGLSADQVAAFASTVASLGVNPEAAGSALSRIFNRTAVEIANASKKAHSFAKFMGVSFNELKASYLKNPEQFFVGFFKKVHDVFTKGTMAQKLELKAQLKGMGFSNVRDINVIQAMADGYEELTRQLGIAKGATTELDQAAQSRFKSFASQWAIFKNNVTASMITIGDEMMPAIAPAFKKIEDWMNKNHALFVGFGKDIANGISGVVDMLTPENLDKAVSAMKSIAGYAKTFIDGFLNMPEPLRNLLLGLYVGNKLTGGVVADVLGDALSGGLKQLFGRGSATNPMFVIPMGPGLGGGGVGGVAAGPGAAMLLGPTAIVIAAIAAYQHTLDENNQQAGKNINETEYLGKYGSTAEIQAAIANLQRIPSELNPIQKALYDLNYQGIKTHNEDLIKYLQSRLDRPHMDDPHHERKYRPQPLHPKELIRFAGTTLEFVKAMTQKQNVTNATLGTIAHRPIPRTNLTAKTTTIVNLKVDGQKVATAVYNSTASAPTPSYNPSRQQ